MVPGRFTEHHDQLQTGTWEARSPECSARQTHGVDGVSIEEVISGRGRERGAPLERHSTPQGGGWDSGMDGAAMLHPGGGGTPQGGGGSPEGVTDWRFILLPGHARHLDSGL
jgi:hypothetical protein